MKIGQLLTYTDNCRRLLQATLAAHPDVFDTPFQTTGAYPSIHALVVHCIGAEQRWVEQRLQGQPGSARYEDRAAATLAGVFSDWALVRAKTRAVIDADHDASRASGLQRSVTFSLPEWDHTGILTVEEVLFHVFNHQIYHLGQISLILQQQGVTPPDFDYVVLQRDSDE